MTDHDGKLSTLDRQARIPMQTADDPDEIFELASIKTSAYDSTLDAAVSIYYRFKQ